MKFCSDDGLSAYAVEPVEVIEDIPVFCSSNDYIENYEKIASDHVAQMKKESQNPWIDEESWEVMEASTRLLISKWTKAQQKILDVGVGLGRLLAPMQQYQRYGVDIALPYQKIAAENGINVCKAELESLPYRNDFFDVIVCTDVLEHVLNFDQSVRTILNKLKVGGVFIFRVPYRESLGIYTTPDYPYYYAHVRNFDENSLFLQFTRCFNCEFLELSYALYKTDESKFYRRIPTILQRLIVKAARGLLPDNYAHYIIGQFLYPTFINFVVRKK